MFLLDGADEQKKGERKEDRTRWAAAKGAFFSPQPQPVFVFYLLLPQNNVWVILISRKLLEPSESLNIWGRNILNRTKDFCNSYRQQGLAGPIWRWEEYLEHPLHLAALQANPISAFWYVVRPEAKHRVGRIATALEQKNCDAETMKWSHFQELDSSLGISFNSSLV